MNRWKLYPLELFALLITSSELPAYKITDDLKISKFKAFSPQNTDVEKIISGLLFKGEDILAAENKNLFDHLNSNDGKLTVGKKEISSEILNMLTSAGPEVEKIYAAIKKLGFAGRKEVTTDQYMDAAIKYFRLNKKEFALVKKAHLLNRDLYSFRDGHAKDDFIGKLLQKIANDLDLDINNYQEIYQIYKSTKRLRKERK